MKKLEISASFLCLCVVIILTSLAFFYQKGNTTDGTVGSDSPDKERSITRIRDMQKKRFFTNLTSLHSLKYDSEVYFWTG